MDPDKLTWMQLLTPENDAAWGLLNAYLLVLGVSPRVGTHTDLRGKRWGRGGSSSSPS